MSDVEDPSSPHSHDNEALPKAFARQLVKQCRKSAENYAHSLFEPLAKQLDDDLSKLAENTQEVEKAQHYNDSRDQLRSSRENLAAQFESIYSQLLSQTLNPAGLEGGGYEVSAGGLSLVDDSQLEESLVVEQITAKIFEQYSDELYALEQRLGLVLPGLKMDEGKIPFGSAAICKAFEMLLQPLEFEIKIKLAIYRSLERTLLESMGSLFDELNEILRQAGVMPEIKRIAKKNESSERAPKKEAEPTLTSGQGEGGGEGNGGTGTGGGDGDGVSAGAGVAHNFQGIQQLAGLFAEGTFSDPAKQAELVATPVTPQLVEALSGLQVSDELFEAGAEISGEEFKARIKAQLSERDGAPDGGISQLDDETIDVISMIFDDLMNDEALPDFIKALLGRLQIPVLKVAIIDRVFFAEKDHPARALLNELTIAGQVASTDEEESANLIYQKIESVVLQLVGEFQGDLAIFDSCLADLRAFMAEREAGFEAAQQEISERAQKNSFAAQTRKNVAEEIANRLLKREVPEDVRAFLMDGWRHVLSTIILKEGEECAALKRAEQVTEDLIWSVEPLKKPEAKKKLLLVVPLILDALKEGLEMIGYTDAQILEVNQMLEQYHIANIKSGKQTAATAADGKAPVVDEIDQMLQDLEDELDLPAAQRIGGDPLSLIASGDSGSDNFEQMMKSMGFDDGLSEDDAPRINDRYTVQVDVLEEGAWVELQDDNGDWKRTKLAWKGDEFTKYAFVNWRYKVVAEKSYYGLADEFRQGNAAIIEDLPLFDRAFDSVFTKIMKLAG